jgi:hypothetical protein
MHTLYQRLQDSVKMAGKEAEKKRVKGTKPSLPLARYAGTYADSLYGSVTVRLEAGRLVLIPSTFLTADLEHWNYDTFRARYRNRWISPSMITVRLGADGKPSALDLGEGKVLERVRERERER